MRRLILIISMALLIAACGDDADDDASDTGGEQSETTPDESTEPSADDDADPPAEDTESGGSEGSGTSTATVTLGDETYNFTTEGAVVAQCLGDFFGVFSAQLVLDDGSGTPGDGRVSIVALHEGTDPETVGEVNSVEIDVGDETWVADEASEIFAGLVEPGMSQVDSVEVDGNTARGTATFVRQGSVFGAGDGEIETMTGTFEATCVEDQVS